MRLPIAQAKIDVLFIKYKEAFHFDVYMFVAAFIINIKMRANHDMIEKWSEENNVRVI
jgi:hypothetical protein